MKGHEELVAMRSKRKVRPTVVFIDTDPDESPMPSWRDWHTVNPALPRVLIEHRDSVHRLDLRFVRDMTVILAGSDAERVRAVAKAALEHDAARVVTAELVAEPSAFDGYRVTRTTDTEEVLAWQI